MNENYSLEGLIDVACRDEIGKFHQIPLEVEHDCPRCLNEKLVADFGEELEGYTLTLVEVANLKNLCLKLIENNEEMVRIASIDHLTILDDDVLDIQKDTLYQQLLKESKS